MINGRDRETEEPQRSPGTMALSVPSEAMLQKVVLEVQCTRHACDHRKEHGGPDGHPGVHPTDLVLPLKRPSVGEFAFLSLALLLGGIGGCAMGNRGQRGQGRGGAGGAQTEVEIESPKTRAQKPWQCAREARQQLGRRARGGAAVTLHSPEPAGPQAVE